MYVIRIKILVYIAIILYYNFLFATTYALTTHNSSRLIGKNLKFITPENNIHSLEYFSNKFQVGLRNMLEINPTVDLYLPDSKKLLIIPKQLILPDTVRTGIIINSAETRLFYYPKNNNVVVVFPISIGTPEHETPSYWLTTVKYKKKNPTWIPTQDMRNEYLQHGEILPKIFPPGPHNPMGSYALYIGKNYAIHGTNSYSNGIGLRVTRGCIRLRPKDIEYLYTSVPIGTRVEFINEPVKVANDVNGKQYIEVHRPLYKINKNCDNYLSDRIKLKQYVYAILEKTPNIDYTIVDQAIEDCSGIPINITNR